MIKHWTVLFFLIAHCFSGYSQALSFSTLKYQLISGSYVGILGGINGGYDLRCERIRTNRGYYVGAKIGRKIFSLIRLEGDFNWQGNEVRSIRGAIDLFDHVKGRINIWSLMANGLFDFSFNCCLPARPFIGGGVGYAYAEGYWSGKSTETEIHVKSSLHKEGVAGQFIAGLNFTIYCCLDISLEYRFFKANNCISNHKLGLALTRAF